MRRDEHRVAICGRMVAPDSGVRVRRAGDGAAHYSGLAVCGNVACCPVCGPKVRHGRAQEIARAARAHQQTGGGLVLLTLTAPHDLSMPLTECWRLIREAWRSLTSGNHGRGMREQHGIVGFVRAVETTHGRAGWHTHIHALVFTDRPWDDLGVVTGFWRWIHERWARRIVAMGGRPPSLARGVQVIPCRADNDALAVYLSAVGGDFTAEVAMESGKKARTPGSRTPLQLLHDAVEYDDPAAWMAFREWMTASHGRQLITWSRGLRARLLGTDETPADEDLVREHDHAEVVVELDREAWREVLMARADVELLIAVEHGTAGIQALIRTAQLALWLDTRGREGPPVIRCARRNR
ncbi:MAG: hypothetical protein U0237_13995 [Thermoleophilia bacterium]